MAGWQAGQHMEPQAGIGLVEMRVMAAQLYWRGGWQRSCSCRHTACTKVAVTLRTPCHRMCPHAGLPPTSWSSSTRW